MTILKRFVTILFFILFANALHAFEYRKYVIEELKSIANTQQHLYHFYAGKHWDNLDWKPDETEIVELLLKTSIGEGMDSVFRTLGTPKNIAESKMLAQYIWDFNVYLVMQMDYYVRERKY